MLVPLALLLATLLAAAAPSGRARAQWLEGVASWADATIGLASAKWKGPRVPFPQPGTRPSSTIRLDSQLLPLSVHGSDPRSGERLLAVLAAAEATHELASAAGLLDAFGDAGQGGTGARDIYVSAHPSASAAAFADARGNFAALDGARAYAVLDARIPSERVFVCTAQALFEAQLLELDPAEAESVRASTAAYFAGLVSGEPGCDDSPDVTGWARDAPFADASSGAAWLRELAAREDQNRGLFVHEMWQFARQRTWEGHDLRASPDLFEAIVKALELKHVTFAQVASEIASTRAQTGYSLVRSVPFARLPAFLRNVELEPLASLAAVVRLGQPQPGTRLRVWSRGELGARHVLAATRLGPDDAPLAHLTTTPRREPESQLSIELDAQTEAVLITVTNLGAGIPDLDPPVPLHAVALTIDHAP